jgi:hypothetical protein
MKRVLKIWLFILTLLTLNKMMKAQSPLCVTRGLSKMFLEKNVTDERIYEFSNATYPHAVKSKKTAIDELVPHQSYVFTYTQKALKTLFEDNLLPGNPAEIRLFFALYKSCPSSPLPISDDQIIILFSGVSAGSPPDKYYFLNNNDDKVYIVDKNCGDNWCDGYEKTILPALNITIDSSNPDDSDGGDKFSDTKSIVYETTDIKDAFKYEEEYQLCKHKIAIIEYKMSFSAFTDKGNNKGKYKKRLHVQFEYVYIKAGKKEILQQETQGDYSQRKPLTKFDGLDNGQLCPVNCK